MKHNVKAPSVGESITEVSILKWAKKNGEAVNPGDLLLEIESDKATVEIVAEAAGVLQTLKAEGERIPVGEVIALIDDAATPSVSASSSATPTVSKPASAPGPAVSHGAGLSAGAQADLSPAVRKAVVERGLDPALISGTGKDGRLTKGDVLQYAGGSGAVAASSVATPAATSIPPKAAKPGERRVAMSMLRARIAERLVQAQHTAAILTTFNEVDMGPVMELRNKVKEDFKAKHGVSLGFMSFFTRASVEALKAVPEVNAYVEGKEIVYHDYYDIGIAVGTERGLVVPVLRNAGEMNFVQIEKGISEMALKARDGKLSINDLTGGTFTISNGGVYGSLMSTPILNPPQSGILGMHKIQDRPMAVNGKVEIRPMMFLALSYDHRLIDGKGAVTFLIKLKEHLENPMSLGFSF